MIELINTFLLLLLIVWIYLMQNEKKNDVHFYVARDKHVGLYLYLGKPVRGEVSWEPIEGCNVVTYEEYFHQFGLRLEDFKDLKWEDEPLEVFITVK